MRKLLLLGAFLLPTLVFFQLYNGQSIKLDQQEVPAVVPFETMARLLTKAKFTARFTSLEVQQVSHARQRCMCFHHVAAVSARANISIFDVD